MSHSMIGSWIEGFRGKKTQRSRKKRFNRLSTTCCRRSLVMDPLEDRRLLALTYELTPLGTLGGTASVALGSSIVLVGGSQGNPIFELQIVGASTLSGDATEEAAIWAVDSNGTVAGPTSLGLLPGDTNSKANDINALGFIAGRSGTSQFGQPPVTGDRAFLYSPLDGSLTDLGDLPGGDDFSEATGMSLTQVVGSSAASTGLRGFVWEQTSGMTDLGDLPGGADFSFALDVNNAGKVVGGSGVANGQNAFIWDSTNGMQDIGALPVTGQPAFAEAAQINEAGLVVGRSLTDVLDGNGNPTGQTVILAFAYNSADANPVMAPLPPVIIDGMPAAVNRPFGMNELGAIVGSGNTVGNPNGDELNAWLFSPLRGTVNLNDTLNASGAGWTLLQARDIDDAGRIVGYGTNPNGDLEAFLLTPVNDPPVLDPIGNQTASEGTLFQLPITASDPNGDSLTFVLGGIDGNGNFQAGLNVPPGMTVTTIDPMAGTGQIDWTPDDDSPTPFSVTVAVVDDGAGFLSDFETIQITVNNLPPTADAGGPYVINEGDSLALSATASDPAGANDPLTFSWDVNGDGIFGDATGQNPTLTWAQLNALGIDDGTVVISNLRVRVADDDGGVTDSAPSTLTVNNVGPDAAISGPATAVPGLVRTYTLTATDPSAVDQAANFTFQIDWDGDSVIDETVVGPSGTQVQHSYNTTATNTVSVTALDKDGDAGMAGTTTVDVTMFLVEADPNNPSQNNLYWGGTDGLDAVFVLPGLGANNVVLFTAVYGFFFINQIDNVSNVDKIILFGLGNADIMATDFVNLPVEMYGANGDDVLSGGLNNDLIDGGPGNDMFFGTTGFPDGNDTMLGGTGRDFFYGNFGSDSILGGDGDDLLISGRVDFGAAGDLLTGLTKIRNEWLSSRDYATRVDNIKGTGTGPRLNGNFFLQPGVTLFDDGAADELHGEGDMDWFVYTFLQDTAADVEPGEEETDMP